MRKAFPRGSNSHIFAARGPLPSTRPARPRGNGMMAEDPIRVLQLIKCLDHGGAEHLLTTMVIRGDRSRFRYEVAFARSEMRGLVGVLRDAGVPVHDLGARSDLDLAWTARRRPLLTERRFEVVHAHLPY